MFQAHALPINLDKMLRQVSHGEFQIATQNNMKPLNSPFRAGLMSFLFFHSQKGSIGITSNKPIFLKLFWFSNRWWQPSGVQQIGITEMAPVTWSTDHVSGICTTRSLWAATSPHKLPLISSWHYLNEINLDKMLHQISHGEFQIATQNNMKPLNSPFRAGLMSFLFFHSQKGSIGTRLKWRCTLQLCKPAHIIPTNQTCDTGMQAQSGSHHNKHHLIW